MDEPAQSARRQQASRRSSTQRLKPRGRASTQSLQSNGRPSEATFTSFEPFSPPPPPPPASFSPPARDSSVDSASSSKRSRSIYAPNRKDSVDNVSALYSLSRRSTQTSQPSQASRSLMAAITDIDQGDDSLFAPADLQAYRQNPSVLEKADNATLRTLCTRQSTYGVIRTLAKDLAARDAEVTRLRIKLDAVSALYKDHLCSQHDLSRLEADKAFQDMNASGDNAEDEVSTLLGEASLLTIKGMPATEIPGKVFAKGNKEAQAGNAVTEQDAVPATQPINGMMRLFGSMGTIRASKDKEKRKSIGNIVDTANQLRVNTDHHRKTSVGQGSIRSALASPIPGPVEMNAIVEVDEMPPPLISERDIQAQYPAFTADVYGFIIDGARVEKYYQLKRQGYRAPRVSDAADSAYSETGTTVDDHADIHVRSVSVPSLETSKDELSINESTEAENVSSASSISWTEYLRCEMSTLNVLSYLPSAPQVTKPGQDLTLATSDYNDLGQILPEDVSSLRSQLAAEYKKLQQAKTYPWERYLASETRRKGEILLAPPITPKMVSPSTVGPSALDQYRNRLILSGVPMHLRSKIWSEAVHETMVHDPDEYRLLSAVARDDLPSDVMTDISDDIPRTLANNVFFRVGKGQDLLTKILASFALRRPDIGYCQGMNLIAAYLLLAIPSPETAFWVFCYTIEHGLADVYRDTTMRGVRIEVAVLRSYVRDCLPELAAHLDNLGVAEQETVPFNWFLTAFATTLPVEALYRLWDVLIALPTQKNFLLRVAIALLKVNESVLLGIEDSFQLRTHMDQKMGPLEVGVDGLIKAALKLGAFIKDEGKDGVKARREELGGKLAEIERVFR